MASQAPEAEEVASLDRILTRLALTDEDKLEKVAISEVFYRLTGSYFSGTAQGPPIARQRQALPHAMASCTMRPPSPHACAPVA